MGSIGSTVVPRHPLHFLRAGAAGAACLYTGYGGLAEAQNPNVVYELDGGLIAVAVGEGAARQAADVVAPPDEPRIGKGGVSVQRG